MLPVYSVTYLPGCSRSLLSLLRGQKGELGRTLFEVHALHRNSAVPHSRPLLRRSTRDHRTGDNTAFGLFRERARPSRVHLQEVSVKPVQLVSGTAGMHPTGTGSFAYGSSFLILVDNLASQKVVGI